MSGSAEKLNNVSVTRAANIYFDGKVSSRTVEFEDGTHKTLGIMLPGEYEFSTQQAELMEITAGYLLVKLPSHEEWQEVRAGDEFRVPANARFQLHIQQVTDYVCTYL